MMLENKVALVTGASRGIGRQIAITLASEGAYVIVNYNGSEAAAKEVVDTITANGGSAEWNGPLTFNGVHRFAPASFNFSAASLTAASSPVMTVCPGQL